MSARRAVAAEERRIEKSIDWAISELLRRRIGGEKARDALVNIAHNSRADVTVRSLEKKFRARGGILLKIDIRQRAQHWLAKHPHATARQLLAVFSSSQLSVLSRANLGNWAWEQIQAARRSEASR